MNGVVDVANTRFSSPCARLLPACLPDCPVRCGDYLLAGSESDGAALRSEDLSALPYAASGEEEEAAAEAELPAAVGKMTVGKMTVEGGEAAAVAEEQQRESQLPSVSPNLPCNRQAAPLCHL